MNQLYIIEYENAHWCGGLMYCVVWAEDEIEAEDLAADFMEQEQRELFSDHYGDPEEENYDDEQAYTIISVELLEESTYVEFYTDAVQRANFYPCVNPDSANPASRFAQYM